MEKQLNLKYLSLRKKYLFGNMVGRYCCVRNCRERFVKGGPVTFHRFPKDSERRQIWLNKLKMSKVSNYSSICSKHFSHDSFNTEKFGGTWLRSDAIPSIVQNTTDHQSQQTESTSKIIKISESNGTHNEGKPFTPINHPDFIPSVFSSSYAVLPHEREKKLKYNKVNVIYLNQLKHSKPQKKLIVQQKRENKFSEKQTATKSKETTLKTEIASLNLEIVNLRKEKEELKRKLEASSTPSSILSDEEKCHFYTGLPSLEAFDWLLNEVKDSIPNTCYMFSLKEQLLIVLMKLKLNLLVKDLAFRFCTSRRTISRILTTWLPILKPKFESHTKYPIFVALLKSIKSTQSAKE